MDAGSGGGLGPSMIAPTNFNPSSHAIIRPLQTADPLQADKERLTEFAEQKPFSAVAAYSKEFDWADIQTERPMTFLIDRDGVIVDYFTGGYDFSFFESKIIDHLDD